MAYHATKAELKPFPDVPPFLRRVHATGDIVLGVITHGLEIKQAEKLLLLNLLQWINPSAIFISDQLGISKPNPKLYQRACSALGLDPHEAMYIGDSPLSDVDPVNHIGMISVRILRENRFTGQQGQTQPRFTIGSFDDLVPILADEFGVRLPD